MLARPRSLGGALLLASAALAIIFGLTSRAWHDSGELLPLLAAFKASSIVLLAALAVVGRAQTLVVYALVFGAAGDALLALDRLEPGALAFLIGHICYIRAFLRTGEGVGALLRPVRGLSAVALAGASVASTALLVPRDSTLFVPLAIYTMVLTLMVIASFTLPGKRWLTMTGAVLFLISDGFVAANLFHPQSDPSSAFALSFTGWMIYWAAQAALCTGMLQDARRTTAESA